MANTENSQDISAEQECLLYRLVDKDQDLKSTRFISLWEFVAEQLNTLEGPKKTAKEWWLRYQLENNNRIAGPVIVASKKTNIQPTTHLNPSTSSTELVTSAPGQTGNNLNTLAAALNYLNTNDIFELKRTTMHKLNLLLRADDHNEWLHPSFRMTITDWLLVDTLLVHENFDVIQMHRAKGTDHKALIALFHLVEKYNIESLKGDYLAEAWAALTIEYNATGRQSTPMLLQRRWYQLKLTSRESIYKFRFIYLETPNDTQRLLKFKPTSLQLDVLLRYSTKVVLEPFMSWEDQIKNGLVILREQFVSIAMKSKIRQTPSTQIETLASIDLTSTETREQEENNSDAGMNKMKIEMMIEPDKPEDNEMDTENYPLNDIPVFDKPTVEVPGPFSEITGFDKQKPILPQITNVFGNVHVPIEALPKISVLATKITRSNVVKEKYINVSLNEQNNQINDGLEIDKTEAIDGGTPHGIVADEKKKVPTKDEKLLMIPKVNTVKLDEMGVLPMRLLRRVRNKVIIDIITAKSKITENIADKLKCTKKIISKTVELSSSSLNKSRKRSYSYSQLSKNPDFNIALKKLNREFFKSDRNRMLLRACKPLCIVVDKSFESKLENGTMYNIKPTAFCQSDEAFEQMTPNESHPNVSLESLDTENFTRNTNTEQAFIPIVSQPVKNNISLSIVPTAIPSNSPRDLGSDMLPSRFSSEEILHQNTHSLSQKFITIVPSKTNESPDTEPLSVNNNKNDNSAKTLLDLYTLNRLLCMLFSVEMKKGVQNDILATAKQNEVVYKSSIDVKDTSETIANKSGTEIVNTHTSLRKKRKYLRKNIKPCCWAQAKLWSIDRTGKRLLPPHNCEYPSCECCCKEILAKYYENKKRQKRNSKVPKDNNELEKKFNELNDSLADVVTTFSDKALDKFLSLGNNKILLTTTKFPKNFSLFTGFQRYLENNLKLPEAIRLVLKPNGRVLLKRDIRKHVNPEMLKQVIDLVDEFNQLSRLPNAQHKNININNDTFPDKSPNTALNKESSCVKDTKELCNPLAEHIKESPNSVSLEQLKSTHNPISGYTNTTNLPAQLKQEPVQLSKENATVIDEVKSCLGILFCKTLTPIKLVSELNYAYSQNGLFFKLDLDSGSLVPINVCIKMNRIPILHCDPVSGNSSSVPKKNKTFIPINSQSLPSLTYNDTKSMSSQSPVSILSTSPEPISSSLPEDFLCKPIESNVSEFSIPTNNGICNVSNISYPSNLPSIENPLVSLKVEDESIISDDDNAESWNVFDKFLNIDDGPEEYIKQQKESSNAPIGFEEDQMVKILKVEQV